MPQAVSDAYAEESCCCGVIVRTNACVRSRLWLAFVHADCGYYPPLCWYSAASGNAHIKTCPLRSLLPIRRLATTGFLCTLVNALFANACVMGNASGIRVTQAVSAAYAGEGMLRHHRAHKRSRAFEVVAHLFLHAGCGYYSPLC